MGRTVIKRIVFDRRAVRYSLNARSLKLRLLSIDSKAPKGVKGQVNGAL